jgi:hypothetical protein
MGEQRHVSFVRWKGLVGDMHFKMFCVMVGAVFALCVAASAMPIPGSDNEIQNPGFEANWNSWERGAGLDMGQADGHGNAVYCKDPSKSLLLRQVVDESTNTLWDWDKHAKWIDLTAQILCEDLSSPSTSGVRFGIDWWSEEYNTVDDPGMLPAHQGPVWVTVYFADIPNYQPFTWVTVNPFDVNKTLFSEFQPRWVSVEAELIQGTGEVVWIDNLDLTSMCVPEPSAIFALITGLVGMSSASRLFRRRK